MRAQVAGVQPAVDQRLRGGLLVLVVALEDVGPPQQQLAVLGDLGLHARDRLADRAEAELLGRVHRGHRGGLGHAVALHDRHAAGVEELQDLPGDRRGAGDALADVAAEQVAHVGVELLLGGVEARLQLCRDVLARGLQLAHLDADGHRLRQLLGILGVAGGQRVDLLEDPRHRREVGRLDLHQVGDDLLGVLLPVRHHPAQVERQELDQLGERVRQRQEQVHDLALAQDPLLLGHADHVAVVAVAEDAALGRPGGARRVDVDADVVLGHGRGTRLQLGGVARSGRARAARPA